MTDAPIIADAAPTAHGAGRTLADGGAGRLATRTLLGFLLIHLLLHMDRSAMAVVMEPVKREFHLTDTHLGLFSIVFAAAFGLAGIPLGRLTDRMSRRRVLAGCIAFFSLATAACGLAQNVGQLLLARFAVGAGEAGGRPAMLSMISDLYPPERRAFATSVYYLGIPIGFVLTFLVGGWLAGHLGWRTVFMAAGTTGLVAALATLVLLKEPTRGASDAGAPVEPLPWARSVAEVLGGAAMRHVLVTTMLTSLLSAGVISWAVSFLVRSHGLSLPQAGLVMALAYGAVGAIGTLGGGWTIDRLARRDVRWRAWIPAVAVLLALPALAGFILSPSLALACVALGIWAVVNGAVYAPGIALTQSLASPRSRGTAAAIFYLLSNVAGSGLGPLAVGMLSDALRPTFGTDSVRFAILTLSGLYLWAGLHFFLAGRRLPHSDSMKGSA